MNTAETIFTSPARCYADYRPRYPRQLFGDLRERTVGEYGEHLLDWGAGSGELSIPLCRFFDRVTAVDVHPEKISVAKEKARSEKAENIEWVVSRAEDFELGNESCDLITVGSAFHWMDRELLARRAFRALKAGSALALAGGAGGGPVWKGGENWHRLTAEILEKHLDRRRLAKVKRRKGANAQAAKPHGDILSQAGFRIESFNYPTEFAWGVDEVIGYLYSVAFVPPPLALTNGPEAFERELRETLTRANPLGVFRERIDFNLTIAFKLPHRRNA